MHWVSVSLFCWDDLGAQESEDITADSCISWPTHREDVASIGFGKFIEAELISLHDFLVDAPMFCYMLCGVKVLDRSFF